MADHVFIVLSEPPADVDHDDFDAWYATHVREIVALPGWVGAERFSLRFVHSRSGENPSYEHYVRYEVDGDFDTAWGALREAVDTGRMTLPEWFPRLRTAGWMGTRIGERVTASAAGQAS